MPVYQTSERVAPLTGDIFELAVAEHHQRLAGLAFVMPGNRQMAEDLVAEAYARVWGRIGSRLRSRPVDDLGSFLRRVVVNLARSHRWLVERTHAETRFRPDDAVVVTFEDRVDVRHSLHAALLSLPVEQRAVIVLRHLEHLSEQETARLSTRRSTGRSRCSLHQRLRAPRRLHPASVVAPRPDPSPPPTYA